MELDELKAIFAQQQRTLESSLRLNEHLLAASNLGAVRGSVNRFSAGLWFELIANALFVLFLGSFTADHAGDARFAVPAIVLWIFVAVVAAGQVAQIVSARSLDFDEPVVALQEHVANLRVARANAVRWTMILAPVMWVPLLIVGLRAVGVDAYALAGVPYLVVSAIVCAAAGFGIALISPKFRDALAGRPLAGALDALDTVRRFSEEPAN